MYFLFLLTAVYGLEKFCKGGEKVALLYHVLKPCCRSIHMATFFIFLLSPDVSCLLINTEIGQHLPKSLEMPAYKGILGCEVLA